MTSLDSITERNQFAAHIDVLSRTLKQADQLLGRLKIAPATKKKKLFALIALNEIVRKCKSIEAMAHADAWAGIVAVARSTFESYADLINCLTIGDDYGDYMLWMSLNQQRSMMQALCDNPASSYYLGIQSQLKTKGQRPESVLAETKNEMAQLAARLPKRFKNARGNIVSRGMFRFELAGKIDEYNVLYRRQSGSAHGFVSDIVDGLWESGDFRWPAGPIDPPLVAADSACALLLESCGRVAKAYRKPEAPFVRLTRLHFQLKRSLYG